MFPLYINIYIFGFKRKQTDRLTNIRNNEFKTQNTNILWSTRRNDIQVWTLAPLLTPSMHWDVSCVLSAHKKKSSSIIIVVDMSSCGLCVFVLNPPDVFIYSLTKEKPVFLNRVKFAILNLEIQQHPFPPSRSLSETNPTSNSKHKTENDIFRLRIIERKKRISEFWVCTFRRSRRIFSSFSFVFCFFLSSVNWNSCEINSETCTF